MLKKYFSNSFAPGFLAIAVLIGCGKTPQQTSSQPSEAETATQEHIQDEGHMTADDVERPADYADAVVRIKSYRDAIRDEIAAGRPGKAHQPLDEMNFVVEWLPEIAQQSNVPKQNWEALNTAAQAIRALLDQVHERIDNGEQPDFESVAEDIQKEIDTLESIRNSDANSQQPETDGNELGVSDKGEDE